MKTTTKVKRFIDKKKYVIIASLVALILIGGIVQAQTGGFWSYIQERIAQIVAGKIDTPALENLEELTVGAMPGSSLPGPSFTVSGITQIYKSQTMSNATTVPCVIKSPTASSTIVSATAYFNYASTSETILADLAYSTTNYASTTVLGRLTMAAAAGGSLVGTSTTAANQDIFAAPNSYIILKITGGAGSSNTYSAPSGVCQVIWRLLKPEGRF